MSPYLTIAAGTVLLALSIAVGGLYWLAGVILVVWGVEVRSKRQKDRAVNEMRDRARRQLHSMYGD